MIGRLTSDQSGATIVEFAILLPVVCMLLIGGFDAGYQSYVRTVMQAALNDSARRAAVETPTFAANGEDMEEKIEATIASMVGKVAVGATIDVTQQSYSEFSGVGNPEPLMTDVNENGEYDADDGDCWQDANGNGEFDTDAGKSGRGEANDVVFYTADISMPRLFPIDAFLPVGDLIEMSLETAVRNQPFGNRAEPVVLCGSEE